MALVDGKWVTVDRDGKRVFSIPERIAARRVEQVSRCALDKTSIERLWGKPEYEVYQHGVLKRVYALPDGLQMTFSPRGGELQRSFDAHVLRRFRPRDCLLRRAKR